MSSTLHFVGIIEEYREVYHLNRYVYDEDNRYKELQGI